MRETISASKAKYPVYASGLLSSALGAGVIIGWLTQNETIIQLYPSLVPMQFNTALCFLLTGFAIMVNSQGSQRRLLLPSLIVLAIGSLTLFEYFAGSSVGIDELFMDHYITVATSNPGRMAPNTALCFTIAGLGLLALRTPISAFPVERLTGIAGAVVIGLGCVALLGYILNLDTAYGWGNMTRMAPHTAIGFIIVGVGLLAIAGLGQPRLSDLPWLSPAIGFTYIAFTISFWQAIDAQHNRAVEDSVNSRRRELHAELVSKIEIRSSAIQRMANRWELMASIPEIIWRGDAQNYLLSFPDFQAIEWADDTFHVRLVEPIAGNENAINLNLASEPRRKKALETARATGRFAATDSIDLVQGGKGFLLLTPIGRGDNNLGFIVAVFRIDELFDSLSRNAHADFYVEVYEQSDRIYSSIRATKPLQSLVHRNDVFPIDVLGNEWQLRFAPRDAFLATHDSILTTVFLISNLLVGLSLSLIIHYWQQTHRSSIASKAMGDTLRHEVLQRRDAEERLA